MAQPNVPAPAAPAAPAPVDSKVQAPADPKAQGKGPEVPPSPAPAEGADKNPPEAKKPANAIETEMADQFGEEWNTLSPKAKERVIAAEMKAREADKRMQLAAKLKKDLDLTNAQVAQLIAGLRQDPWKVLSNPALGHDVRKLAEEYVWQMIQEQRMTPEQREAMQNKAELASLKAQQEQGKKDQEQREMEALISQRRAYWEKTISEAIDAEKLPKTSYVVRRFADYVRAAARSRQPADMPGIASQIRQELVELQSKFLLPPKREGETDDQYEERVLVSAPNDYVKLLRKADLKRLRASGKLPKPGPKPAPGQTAKAGPKKMSMSEWLNNRDQRLGRK